MAGIKQPWQVIIIDDRLTTWVFIPITPAEALRWIAEEVGKPERIWERLFDACRAGVRLMNPREWEMQGEVVEGGVKVEFWRKE
jgi:hypothetical protein